MSRRKTILTAIVLILIMLIGGMLAFFTDADEDNKVFVLGNVEVRFTSNSSEAFGTQINQLIPNQKISQIAELENVGENDAYVFVKIKVPHISVSVDGAPAEKKDLFSTNMDMDNWKELTNFASEDSNSNSYTHVYAYANNEVLTKLVGKKDETISTAKIFDQISFINVTKPNEITDIFENGKLEIDVTGYAIQADAIEGTPEEVWQHLVQNLVQ